MQNILGQPHAVDALQRALQSSRIHHAWIFSGPRGVGKYTTALEFAKLVLDPGATANLTGVIEVDPEGSVARRVDDESHPDLHVIRKELALFSDNRALRERKLMSIPIDLLREHMIGGRTADDRNHEAAAYRTAKEGHGKVFIIDEAELLAREGQNAILKTLEEPPPHTYIILIASRVERLFPTIRSRCQHLQFGSLDADAMGQWFASSGLEVAGAEREWIASFSEGAPGAAMIAAEFGLFQWHQALSPALARLERGEYVATLGKTLADLPGEFAEAWVKSRRNASKDAANKDGARLVLSILASHARVRLHEGEGNPRIWMRRIEFVREAERQLEANVNRRHAMDNLVVQWVECGARQFA